MEQHSCCCRPSQTIALPGTFDGLLLFAAHEVLTSPEALDHLLPNLNKGSWIVAFGAKLKLRDEADFLNPLLRLLTQTLLPASSAPVDARPWRFLEDRTDKLHVEERMAGLFYLAEVPAISRIQTFWGATARRRDQGVLTPTARLLHRLSFRLSVRRGAHRGLRSEWAP